MKVNIVVPAVGESVVEATVGRFLKVEGSTVKMDEEVVELETAKVNQSVYAPAAGTVHWMVKAGDTVQVGQTLGVINTENQRSAEMTASLEPSPHTSSFVVEHPKTSAPSIEPASAFVVEERVASKQEKVGERRVRMSRLRRTIAERLVEVKNQTAMLTTFNEVDMSALMALREREQESFVRQHGVKLGFMSLFAKACIAALKEYPALNAYIDGDELVYWEDYHIGIAVGTEKGLFVPVLRHADKMSNGEIEKKIKELAEKARAGTISFDELSGGTFTITNGGVYGSMLSTPILNPPQSGILGMHNIVKRTVVQQDTIVIRPVMYLALSYDHRIVDGRESVGFLVHVKKLLEETPEQLL